MPADGGVLDDVDQVFSLCFRVSVERVFILPSI